MGRGVGQPAGTARPRRPPSGGPIHRGQRGGNSAPADAPATLPALSGDPSPPTACRHEARAGWDAHAAAGSSLARSWCLVLRVSAAVAVMAVARGVVLVVPRGKKVPQPPCRRLAVAATVTGVAGRGGCGSGGSGGGGTDKDVWSTPLSVRPPGRAVVSAAAALAAVAVGEKGARSHLCLLHGGSGVSMVAACVGRLGVLSRTMRSWVAFPTASEMVLVGWSLTPPLTKVAERVVSEVASSRMEKTAMERGVRSTETGGASWRGQACQRTGSCARGHRIWACGAGRGATTCR